MPSVSGKNVRQWVTLPDVLWVELDDEAQKAGMKVSEVIKAYIERGRQSDASRLVEMQQSMVAMVTQLGILASVIDERLPAARPAVDPPVAQTQQEALGAMYRNAPGGNPPNPFAVLEPAPVPPAPTRWWRHG